MKRIALSLAALGVMASTASAATYVLDFDTDANSTADEIASLDSTTTQTIMNSRTFIDDGISWIATTGGGAGAALFNSTCAGYTASCNDDADLSPASQNNADGVKGNVLIQQRGFGSLKPNDDANTDIITLTLNTDVSLRWTGVSAIDNGAYRFGTSVDLSELGRIDLSGESETGSLDFLTASNILTKGDQIFLFFDREGSMDPNTTDSGAIDNLRFSVVPVPASLPLMLGGIGVFAALRKRRKS